MSQSAIKPASDVPEAQIAAMLECRYGDGMVYLPRGTPAGILNAARQHGFVDDEGYLTRKGRALLARYHFA
ncbi:MAG TPA: hypothetical protein VIC61_03395 [Gammaproteobacteria bacterium]|jgi:hypothetical protein